MGVTELKTANYKEFIEANKDSFLVIVFDGEFTDQKSAVDCAIKSITDAEDIKDKIVLCTVDVEENNDLATEASVLSVPMIVCMVKGTAVRKIDTLNPDKVITTIREELKKRTMLADLTQGDSKEKFKEYLKKLTNRSSVMIFMKGDPKMPRCGFSRQLMELLSNHNITNFDTFDILQDEDVRQGLKELSDWPTYPQIYVKGEFVGGLDILKQLAEQGELASTLKV